MRRGGIGRGSLRYRYRHVKGGRVKADLVAVRVDHSLIVWMTREQRDQFFNGVDLEAALQHDAPLGLDDVADSDVDT
jgi:hypothetical protein